MSDFTKGTVSRHSFTTFAWTITFSKNEKKRNEALLLSTTVDRAGRYSKYMSKQNEHLYNMNMNWLRLFSNQIFGVHAPVLHMSLLIHIVLVCLRLHWWWCCLRHAFILTCILFSTTLKILVGYELVFVTKYYGM